jgi:hypothetical protein
MRTPAPVVLVVFGLALGMTVPAYAKRPIRKITISRPGVAGALEVTQKEALDLSNPWSGRFIDWSAPASRPSEAMPVCEVTLHAQLNDSALTPIYQFRYAPGADGGRGHVYLPGQGEPWYRRNVRIILRHGHDGRWHAATAAWDAQMKAALHR